MKVTIKEIAERAGVHRATVDKVLHNRVGVSDEVRMKLQHIINEMGYTPNPAGRVLQKQGKKYRIEAILVEVDALPFLKAGIEQGVHNQVGFDIEVTYAISKFQDAERQKEFIDNAIAARADGIIISPINSERVRKAIDRAVDSGIPVVATNADIDGTKRTCCVGINNRKAARIAGRLMGQFLGGTGKIAVVSSAVASENNNYYVQIRENEFADFIHREYPDMKIVTTVDSFEDSQITYEKTVQLLQDYKDLQGIYITCGGVSQVGRALEESGRAKDIRVISFEDYPEVVDLIRKDVIDCTLAGELQQQGEIPVQIIMDYLVFGKEFERRFVGQGNHANRNIIETLTIGWELLGLLPRAELDRIDTKVLDQYYKPSTAEASEE